MKNRIIIIFDHDIVKYPPTLSLISTLLSLKKEVVFVGHYSDNESKFELEKKGVKFVEIWRQPNFDIRSKVIRSLNILWNLRLYKRDFLKVQKEINIDKDDIIWFLFSDKALLLHQVLKNYRYIVQFYEFTDATIPKTRLFYPKYNASKFLQNAKSVVHCEYNRACIMNGMYSVKGPINVLPNKPVIEEQALIEIPEDIKKLYLQIKEVIGDRKAILYQGIFSSGERRLDEFCEAVNMLSEGYVFVAMGGGKYWEELKQKYNSKKFIFIPFVRPPYHLLFTELCSIGVLNYLPVPNTIADVINPLYCAPNKIYEYTKFSKPILCNDIPALREIVNAYNCGTIVQYPMDSESICNAIRDIGQNYNIYSQGAGKYYNSINIKQIVSNILEQQ